MNTRTTIHPSAGRIDWDLDDPKIKRGLNRLLLDLQSIMTEEEIQKIFGAHQKTQSRSDMPGPDRTVVIPVLPGHTDGSALPHKGKPRKRAVRHAA